MKKQSVLSILILGLAVLISACGQENNRHESKPLSAAELRRLNIANRIKQTQQALLEIDGVEFNKLELPEGSNQSVTAGSIKIMKANDVSTYQLRLQVQGGQILEAEGLVEIIQDPDRLSNLALKDAGEAATLRKSNDQTKTLSDVDCLRIFLSDDSELVAQNPTISRLFYLCRQ